jgi:hypothetical protein
MLMSVEEPGKYTPEVNAVRTEELRAHLTANGKPFYELKGSCPVFAVPCFPFSYLAMQCLRTAYRYGQKTMPYVDYDGRVWMLEPTLRGESVRIGGPAGMWLPTVRPELYEFALQDQAGDWFAITPYG